MTSISIVNHARTEAASVHADAPRAAPTALRTSLGRALRRCALDLMRLATDVLPSEGSRAVATWMGAVRYAISQQGPRNARIIRGFAGVSDAEARALAQRYLATMFLDFRFARRVLAGKEDPRSWRCEQRNFDIVRPLIDANLPYLVATGHFAREAQAYIYTRDSVPHEVTTIVAPIKERESGAHYEQILEGTVRTRPDVRFVYAGDEGLKPLLRTLKTPGHAVVIAVDSFVGDQERGSIERIFLGARRRFSTGVARLARMAQCPIVVCTPQLGDDGKPVMIWRKAIEPADAHDRDSDARITNEIIDLIERSVIERPGQYALKYWR